MDHLRAIAIVVDLLGGQTAAARTLGLKAHQNVQAWLRTGVPVERAPDVERACNGAVRAERLCPHVKWVRVKDRGWPLRDGRPCADYSTEAA